MINPVGIWQSQDVTDLLILFYEKNFQKASIPSGLATEIINFAFLNKNLLSETELRYKVNQLYLNSKTYIEKSERESDQLSLIDFSNVETFLDLGANRLDTLNKVGRFFPEIKNLIGIDVIPLNGVPKYPEKTTYYQVRPNSPFSNEIQNVDIINIQYALHHFESDDVIKKTLGYCKDILSKSGKIVIWEESFEESINIRDTVDLNHKKGFFTDFDLTRRFNKLENDKKLEFIIANDWLININNPHMQWTGLYKRWDDWVRIFNDCGFNMTNYHNFGLRVSGHVKSGIHMIGEFTLLS